MEHDERCARTTFLPEVDAARAKYEKAWPDRCWYQAPEEHRRVYLEVEALLLVEAARERAKENGDATAPG